MSSSIVEERDGLEEEDEEVMARQANKRTVLLCNVVKRSETATEVKIINKYMWKSTLGEGSFGKVKLCAHVETGALRSCVFRGAVAVAMYGPVLFSPPFCCFLHPAHAYQVKNMQ